MHMESRVLVQPALHLGVLAGGVAVRKQVQFTPDWCLPFNLTQKAQPLHMHMPQSALGKHLTIQHIERVVQAARWSACDGATGPVPHARWHSTQARGLRASGNVQMER